MGIYVIVVSIVLTVDMSVLELIVGDTKGPRLLQGKEGLCYAREPGRV